MNSLHLLRQVFSLDSITRRDFKTFIILERLAIFVMLSIIEDDFKSAQPSQVFSDLAEALYTNFGHFLDMILYKVRLTQKESVFFHRSCIVTSIYDNLGVVRRTDNCASKQQSGHWSGWIMQ